MENYLTNNGFNYGEIGKDIDLIFAPIFYRLLITGESLDMNYIKNLIDYAFCGLKTAANHSLSGQEENF